MPRKKDPSEPKRKPGRPPTAEGGMQPRMITIDDDRYALALSLGNGSFSAGVRIAIDLARKYSL